MTKRYRQSDLTRKAPKEAVETPRIDRRHSVVTRPTDESGKRKPVINKDRADGLFAWEDIYVIDGCTWTLLVGDAYMAALRAIKDDTLDARQACVARPVL